jgi:hypothetical protein
MSETGSLSPATFHQAAEWIAERATLDNFSELAGIVRLNGVFASARPAGRLTFAHVSDGDGTAVNVEIPSSLLSGRGIALGTCVSVTGRFRIRSSRFGLEARLIASDITLHDDRFTPSVMKPAHQGRITLDQFRALPTRRNAFPDTHPFDVTLLHSSSAESQVYQDCLSEIVRLGDAVTVNAVPVNMLDPAAIAEAIRLAPGSGLLVLIRGGGHAADFAVFEDFRVLSAFAAKTAFRLTGLGHTGNQTLLDRVAEYSASTPTQAGTFIREAVSARQRPVNDFLRQVEADRAKKAFRLLLFALCGMLGVIAILCILLFHSA